MTQVTGWQSCRGEAGTWEDCFGEDSEQSSHSAESSVRTVGNSELYSKRSSKIVPTPTSTARTCKSDSIWHPFAPSDPREPTISPWDFPQQEEQAVVTGTIGVYITGDPHENVRAIPLQVMQTPEVGDRCHKSPFVCVRSLTESPRASGLSRSTGRDLPRGGRDRTCRSSRRGRHHPHRDQTLGFALPRRRHLQDCFPQGCQDRASNGVARR